MIRTQLSTFMFSLALLGSASAQVTSQVTGITVGGPGSAIPVQPLTDADLLKQTSDALHNLNRGTCQTTELLYWAGGSFRPTSSEAILNGLVEKLQAQKYTLSELGTQEDDDNSYLFISGENPTSTFLAYFVASNEGFLVGWCSTKAATKPPKLTLPGTTTPEQPQQPAQPVQTTQPQQPTPPAQTAAPQVKAGFISGKVLDTQGRPLAGARVYISGTTFAQGQRTDFETTTGKDGTYSLRVPDGRYSAKATYTSVFNGVTFGYILYPLSGNPGTEVDSTEGGSLDFQWKLTGRTAYSAPGADSPSSFYGVSIDLSYCGLPARAYCDYKYTELVQATGEGTVVFTLTPTGTLADGSPGKPLQITYPLSPIRTDYPVPNGGGRLVLGQNWEYHGIDWNDIPLGSYTLTAVIKTPDGRTVPLKLGLKDSEVEHASVPITWKPWDNFNPGSYIGGGVHQLKVFIRD